MWAYEFAKKKTRYKVSSLKSFLKVNHDLPKVWFEEDEVPPPLRTNFILRVCKFLTMLCLLIIFTYVMIDFQDKDYQDMCNRRKECYNYCNRDFFPDLKCQEVTGITLIYRGNAYSKFFAYPVPTNTTNFDICNGFKEDNIRYHFISHLNRQARINTCFDYCSAGVGSDNNFISDGRPLCSSLTSSEQSQLLCLYPEESCEYTVIDSEEVLLGDGKNVISFSPLIGFYAMIIMSPIYFIFEILCILLARMNVDNQNSLGQSSKVMAFQVFMTCIFVITLITAIHHILMTHEHGRPNLLWLTFLFAFILDQIKTFIILVLIWYILIKRCGYLAQNEIEFKVVEDPQSLKDEKFLPAFKEMLMKFLESSYFENSSFLLVGIYTIFILYWLAIQDILNLLTTDTLSIIDIVFTILFLVEIIVKTFASNCRYLLDKFNLLDALIVMISFVLNLIGIVAKGLGVLRLIRVGVITVRRITGKETIDPEGGVMKVMRQIESLPQLSPALKKECTWAIEIIENNKLYDINLEMNNNDKNLEMEAKRWLHLASDVSNDTSLWFERDLDDFLKEIHREIEEDHNKQEEDDEKIKGILDLPTRKWNRLVKMLDHFDDFNFDIFKYYEILGDSTLPHFSFRIFHKYSLLEKFNISENHFKQLCTKIHDSFYDKSIYHSPMLTIQTTHTFYYLIRKGKIMVHISDLILMAGLIASLIHDVGHPGVTNSFLISTKHSKAIRYNDTNVLENHHCALGFKLLMDPQNDILETLSEAQSWNVRQIIINMILATDISSHFEQLLAIQTNKKFPEDNKKDKQALMNILLYASDHAIPCMPSMYYFKWMVEQMEEFYQQGDIERKLGCRITPFFDRTTSNPFLFQRGYIDVIVRPIFTTMTQFMPQIKEELIDFGLEKNKDTIEEKLNKIKL